MPGSSTRKKKVGALVPVSKKQVDTNQTKVLMKLQNKVGKILKDARINSNFINVAQTLTPGTTAAIGVLNPVATGDTEQSRDGDRIGLRHIRFSVTATPNSAAAFDACRMILFRWKGPTVGTAPSLTAILQANNIDAPYNLDYKESMVVLYDKKFDLSSTNGTKNIKVNKMLGGVEASYTDVNSTDWNENAVFFLFLCAENTNKSTINYYSRITFSP